MQLIITGKGLEVSDYLNDLVTKKASKLERYFKPETEVRVTLSIERGRHIAEVTVLFAGSVLRCEERSGDMYNSIDACLKKLERMVRKYRTRFENDLKKELPRIPFAKDFWAFSKAGRKLAVFLMYSQTVFSLRS